MINNIKMTKDKHKKILLLKFDDLNFLYKIKLDIWNIKDTIA